MTRAPTARRNAADAVAAAAVIPLLLWLAARSKPSSATSSEGVMLRLHGSNTIGANLAPFLAEEFLKRLGAKDVRSLAGSKPEETTILGTLPGNSSPHLSLVVDPRLRVCLTGVVVSQVVIT
jgi:phosphate transport system substrate-binding protein